MSTMLRPYRKNLTTQGLIYLAGTEQTVTIKNISMSGILVQLNSNAINNDIRDLFNALSNSSLVDLYVPEIRMAGEAKVVRVDVHDENFLIALEFKNVTYDMDNELYKRKAHRKNLPGPGQILIDGQYLEFNGVNVSVGGMMIRLNQAVSCEPGLITMFKFERLDLEGEVEVRWVDPLTNGGSLIGLQFVHMEKSSIKGIPVFAWPLTA